MAPTIVGTGRSSSVPNAIFFMPVFSTTNTPTESLKAWPLRQAGRFYNMIANFDANGTARTLNLRKNSANSGLGLAPPDSTVAQTKDFTHLVHYTAGDTFDLNWNVTGTAPVIASISSLFLADVGTVGFLMSANAASDWGGATFTVFSGPGSPTFEPDSISGRFVVRAPMTFRNMMASVTNNPSPAGSYQWFSRKNGANGNQTFTIPFGVTGIFEDTTNSDTAVSGDQIGFSIVPSADSTQSLTTQTGFTCLYSTTKSDFAGPFPNFTGGTPSFASLYASGTFAVEALPGPAVPIGLDGVFSNMRFNADSNSNTGTSTIAFRNNGANGNQSLTIAASTTGTFEDATHTDPFKATDQLNYAFTGGTSGTLAIAWSGMTLLPFQNSLWQRQRHFLRR